MPGERLARLARGGVEKLNVLAGAGGGERFAIGADGNDARAGGDGRLKALHALRPRPELELLEAARGQTRAVGAEGQRLDEIEMGHAGLVVDAAFEDRRIGQSADEPPSSHVINEDLVRPAAGGEAAVG